MANGLYRSRKRRIIAGVCGGLADKFNVSVNGVRLAFIIGTLVPVVPGPLVYIVLWLLVPEESPESTPNP